MEQMSKENTNPKKNINIVAADIKEKIIATAYYITDDDVKIYLKAMVDGVEALQKRYLHEVDE